jgi:hypothetical protein
MAAKTADFGGSQSAFLWCVEFSVAGFGSSFSQAFDPLSLNGSRAAGLSWAVVPAVELPWKN